MVWRLCVQTELDYCTIRKTKVIGKFLLDVIFKIPAEEPVILLFVTGSDLRYTLMVRPYPLCQERRLSITGNLPSPNPRVLKIL